MYHPKDDYQTKRALKSASDTELHFSISQTVHFSVLRQVFY